MNYDFACVDDWRDANHLYRKLAEGLSESADNMIESCSSCLVSARE